MWIVSVGAYNGEVNAVAIRVVYVKFKLVYNDDEYQEMTVPNGV